MNDPRAPRASWPKQARLLRRPEFLQVYESGWRTSGKWFGAVCLKTEGQTHPKVGFAAPKSLGGSVVRNRVRRRLKEAVRLSLARLGGEWRVVIQGRRGVLDAPFEDLKKEIERLFQRCARS